MAAAPIYAASVKTGQALISIANANRDGTGTLVTVLTAGASGMLLERIQVIAIATTTAGMVRLFLDDGANIRLLDEVEVLAITPTATVRSFRDEVRYEDGLPLPAGWILKAAPHNGESFVVRAHGGDY